MNKRLTLKKMLYELANSRNEIAIGYNDCYDVWHIQYGCRGSGTHIEGCGKSLYSDEDDLLKAVKYFYDVIVLGIKKEGC